MVIKPITFRQASEYVNCFHRHHKSPTGCKFGANPLMDENEDDYGKTWRGWKHEPTKEEMAQTPWKEANDVARRV